MAREKATESPWILVKSKNLLVREVSFSLLLLALLEDQGQTNNSPLTTNKHMCHKTWKRSTTLGVCYIFFLGFVSGNFFVLLKSPSGALHLIFVS
jgi:hypothetical protein